MPPPPVPQFPPQAQAPSQQAPNSLNPILAMLAQVGAQQPQQQPPITVGPPNPLVRAGMGSGASDQIARVGAMAPTPPINPVVDMYDNAPPIVREAIRRRLFTQGM